MMWHEVLAKECWGCALIPHKRSNLGSLHTGNVSFLNCHAETGFAGRRLANAPLNFQCRGGVLSAWNRCGLSAHDFNLAYHCGTPIKLTGTGTDKAGQLLITKISDLQSLFGKKPGTQNG